MNLFAEIEGINYTPFLCRQLNEYCLSDLQRAFEKDGTFILTLNKNNKFAISWWVSPKRTRSYPYARVYDSLFFQGKRVTVIPVLKDEGKDGDRDFLQWDTISLMSLLGVYVVIAFYKDTYKNPRFKNKITNQRFDFKYLKTEIERLSFYQSDAFHWNMEQIKKISELTENALQCYEKISKKLKVQLHSDEEVNKRINEILNEKNSFLNFSRNLAKCAQIRQTHTVQPKEKLSGKKASLTIKNYLGGCYFFTSDEVIIKEPDTAFLIESRHSKNSILPSMNDIEDGLIKMILYTNLKNLRINDKEYRNISMLKLTSEKSLEIDKIKNQNLLNSLYEEAKKNNFFVRLNDRDLKEIVNIE
ncbi:hypothetical protein V4D30_09445 [Thermodesulfovibrio sp. 3907-1M]|uniref:Uncharacterized protein n=1 Tax=Thermodesulfovibrio autotrophicus TaxID=3118333 RepID=A0AAU8GZ56_9BACT